MTNTAKLINKIAKLNAMTVANGCTADEAANAAEMAEAAIFELELEGTSYDEAVEAAELEAFEQMLNADFAAEGDKAVLLLTEETTENTMEAKAKAVPSVTERAWANYRAAEVEAGRKFTAADRKGKSSEWAKAMSKAYDDVTRERRIAAVQHLLKPVPKYDYYSLDYTERSEGRRREANAAAEHNMRIIAEASERPLNQKQAAEAKALGLSVKEYNATKKWADKNGMSVARWMERLAAEDAAQKARERQEQHDRHMEWFSAENNKKVERMRRRGYAARGCW